MLLFCNNCEAGGDDDDDDDGLFILRIISLESKVNWLFRLNESLFLLDEVVDDDDDGEQNWLF